MDLDTNRSGALGEAKVIAKLIEKGFSVFTQFSGKEEFDIVACKEKKLYRIQVKCVKESQENGTFAVTLTSVYKLATGNVLRRFDKSKCDILAIYIRELDKVCFIKVEDIQGGTGIILRKELNQYTRAKGRHYWIIDDL